ncbi:MAG: DUF1816 domain-containing protein [Elainellaceae cyanobacterium]
MNISHLQYSTQQLAQQKWWVKIQTKTPDCTYYFGSFNQKEEAENLQMDYVDNLVREGAKEITVNLENCCPQELTAYEALHIQRMILVGAQHGNAPKAGAPSVEHFRVITMLFNTI